MLTLAEIVLYIPFAAQVLERYGIPYANNGNQTLVSVCKEYGLNYDEVDAELFSERSRDPENIRAHVNFENIDINYLLEFIEGRVHADQETAIITLSALIKEVAINSSYQYRAEAISNAFNKLIIHARQHVNKEEKILFPFVRQLIEGQNKGDKKLEYATMVNPLSYLEKEHMQCESLMADLKDAANGYTCDKDCTDLYRLLMSELRTFDHEMQRHMHLENNVLFPKLRNMEQNVLQNVH